MAKAAVGRAGNSPCHHNGQAVRAGPYEVYAGGSLYLRLKQLNEADVVISLNGKLPNGVKADEITSEWILCELPDFGGVPPMWEAFLRLRVVPELEAGKKLLAYCTASHGRTGTFLASLIALLESPDETPDPIAAVRERHCSHAVESKAQAEAIFALRNQQLPEAYQREFAPRRPAILSKEGP